MFVNFVNFFEILQLAGDRILFLLFFFVFFFFFFFFFFFILLLRGNLGFPAAQAMEN
jgi:hypothetical protein